VAGCGVHPGAEDDEVGRTAIAMVAAGIDIIDVGIIDDRFCAWLGFGWLGVREVVDARTLTAEVLECVVWRCRGLGGGHGDGACRMEPR